MSRAHPTRGLARLLPFALVGATLPLLAPTCGTGGSGNRAFAKNSIIIPMDACYQGDGSTSPAACPGAADAGSVLHAYGLVYQLLQHNIPVYWIISGSKASLTGIDLTVNWSSGAPVGKYDWSNGTFGTPPPNNTTHSVSYRGGPFVVDGSYFAQANAVLQSAAIKSVFDATNTGATPPYWPVNVHVSNVAFTGYVAKAMNGGWTAGGSVPPPIALVNITGGDGLNSLSVLTGYLNAAGLGNVAGAGGSASGPHGSIYDTLVASDMCGSNPNLFQNGYRVLWAPHWIGIGSSGLNATCTLSSILSNVDQFVASGHDYFSECASIGTVEGQNTVCGSTTYDTGTNAQIMTTAGADKNLFGTYYNSCGGTYSNFAPLTFTNFSSPFMQLAEFPFQGDVGAIANYRPESATASSWKPGVVHLIASTPFSQWDLYTIKPAANGSGNTIYLAGHNYNGQVAGTRLVLNTMFNLGSTCVSTNTACDTGLPGVCGQGQMQCVNGALTCVQTVFASPETCDGLDNDCNGLVDDNLTQACYDGPAGTQNVGACKGGVKTCTNGAWGACTGEVIPTTEVCNGLDDDCDGTPDDNIPAQACYTGPVGTAGVGICQAGTQACTNGQWGACTGEVTPGAEVCGDGIDNNCDGQVDEGCGCQTGQTQPCYGGPAGTAGVGVCHAGTQTCSNGTWGACTGQVTPSSEVCNGLDDDCNGLVDEGGVCDACGAGQTQGCYTGPPGTENVGLCKPGNQSCVAGQWGVCSGQVLPGPELCNGLDDDCDGVADDNPLCPSGHACVNGVCVPTPCSSEINLCPEGYVCDSTQHCVLTTCGGSTSCPAGQSCKGGTCVDPCTGVTCGTGSVCAGGICTGGGCYATGCPAGQLCEQGACVNDDCAGVVCPSGTFCRAGYCVQSCAFQTCAAGETCDQDGFCVPDPCATVSCGAGQTCVGGTCQTDPCAGIGCGTGQVCQGGACVDDPCNGVVCPVGSCVGGQCFGGVAADGGAGADAGPGGQDAGPAADAGAQPDAGGSTADAGSGGGGGSGGNGKSKSGCGCGTASPGSVAMLLFGLALFTSRRRRRALGLGAVTLVAAALLAVPSACGGTIRPGAGDGGSSVKSCTLTSECPNGSYCLDNLCTPKPTPDAGADGGGGDAGPACEKCGGTACVDENTNPAHCGSCTNACGSAETCVDGHCGPAGAVAPWIASIAPATVAEGSTPTVSLTGERFQQGAIAHLTGTATALDFPTSYTSATQLQATLDLRHALPGSLELRVVNPDNVISNGVTLQVAAATPLITKLTPSSSVEGQLVTIHVDGSGFLPDPGSICKVSAPNLPEEGLPSHTNGPSALDCIFDLSAIQPGVYAIVVVNDGQLRSNASDFTVLTATPSLASLSPASGRPGAKLSLDVTGSGFDTTSVVQFDGAALPTTWVSGTELFATPLDLTNVAPGTYQVVVVNAGSVGSNPLPFDVTSNPPQLSSMTPTTALQGQSIGLDVLGSGFDATSVVHVFEPGGGDVPLATTLVSAGEVTAPYSLANKPAGNYTVEVVNAGSLGSNSLTLQVLSNVATVTGLSPAGGAQGATVNLALSGDNFLSGAVAYISGSGVASTALNTSVTSPTAASVTGLSLAGWNTGSYAIDVVNPGAAPSNEVGFTVFAGLPTLASLSPTSAALGSTVTVTLTGTNFAKPDAQGLGGSTVHASCSACGVSDSTLPGTVLSTTQIQVAVDTSTAPAGTYAVSVWNPGGNPPPQKSGSQSFTITP